MSKEIDACFAHVAALHAELQTGMIMFYDYGKGAIKRAKVSPDAYVQMALQLAFYKVLARARCRPH